MTERRDRAWMEVDLDSVVRNAKAARSRAGVPIIPMVKADAYGLGAERIALALEAVEPYAYGIATVEEGRALRTAGIERPLIVFTPLLEDEYASARALQLTPTLGFADEITAWTREGGSWHLSIDTGMSRAGVHWHDVQSLRDVLIKHPPDGAFTHYHSAELDDGSMEEQEQRFRDAIARLPVRPRMLHTEASAAFVRGGKSEWDAFRPGMYLYGVGSNADPDLDPEPVIRIGSRIVETRWIEAGESVSYDATYRAESRRRIATIPMGYADGYPRDLGNRASALVKDARVPIVGLVTMDMIMLDVTDSTCDVGDVVTLVGSEESGVVGIGDLAELAGISPYELLTGLRGRLEHYYVGG
jgi:alanine racemase